MELNPQTAKRKYRIRHQRENGIYGPVLLQNRVIQAESAVRALRIAMHNPSIEIESTNNLAACVTLKSGKRIDFWEADPE